VTDPASLAGQRRTSEQAYFGDHTQTAIAVTLDDPPGTAQRHLRLGLSELRAALAGPCHGQPDDARGDRD
jgi:DNA-directed RNA polymerase specialized sigma24 family protein